MILDGCGKPLLLRATEIVQCPSPLDRVLDRPELDPGFGGDVPRCPGRFVDGSSPGLRLQPTGAVAEARLDYLTSFTAIHGYSSHI